jgi:hypothetical protein
LGDELVGEAARLAGAGEDTGVDLKDVHGLSFRYMQPIYD